MYGDDRTIVTIAKGVFTPVIFRRELFRELFS